MRIIKSRIPYYPTTTSVLSEHPESVTVLTRFQEFISLLKEITFDKRKKHCEGTRRTNDGEVIRETTRQRHNSSHTFPTKPKKKTRNPSKPSRRNNKSRTLTKSLLTTDLNNSSEQRKRENLYILIFTKVEVCHVYSKILHSEHDGSGKLNTAWVSVET
jgi:hypothetical protein